MTSPRKTKKPETTSYQNTASIPNQIVLTFHNSSVCKVEQSWVQVWHNTVYLPFTHSIDLGLSYHPIPQTSGQNTLSNLTSLGVG